MEDKEIIERLVENEQRSKSNTKRIDELEEEIKENRELTVAVKEIATEMKHLREDQVDINNRLKKIEEKPMEEYDETKKQIRGQVLGFLLGIALAFIALKLGLGNYI